MNLNLFGMSMRRNVKPLLWWTLSTCLLMALSMAFYPAIADNINTFEPFFEAPVMKTILRAFAMGPERMGSLPGFYTTYASVYMVLIGAFYASFTATAETAGELMDGTFEFLLTRPMERDRVFITKWLAIEMRLLIFCISLCIVTLASFWVLKDRASILYWDRPGELGVFLEEAGAAPRNISEAWDMDEAFFNSWLVSVMRSELGANPEGIEGVPVSSEELEELLLRFENNPESLIVEIKENSDLYMDMFGISASDRDDFMAEMENGLIEYENYRDKFMSDPEFHYEMLQQSPEWFMEEKASRDGRADLIETFPAAEDSIRKMLSPFRTGPIVSAHAQLFLFLSVASALGLIVSLIAKRPKSVSGLMIGLLISLYFINTLSRASASNSWMGWLTPFGLFDFDMMGESSGHVSFKLVLLGCELVLISSAALIVFRKKDIL